LGFFFVFPKLQKPPYSIPTPSHPKPLRCASIHPNRSMMKQ
jgi:hypothetical protein